MLQLMVGWPVCLGVKPHLGWVCWCGEPSLMGGQVCHLQLLLALTSTVILGSESCGTYSHILLSQVWDSPNLEDQVPIYISPRDRMAQLYPQALGSLFVTSNDSQGYSGCVQTCLHMGFLLQLLTCPTYDISAQTAQKTPFLRRCLWATA
jgi:hypothetical protein